MTIARKQNLHGLRKWARDWQFCILFYISQEKEAERGYVKSISGRLKRREKAE